MGNCEIELVQKTKNTGHLAGVQAAGRTPEGSKIVYIFQLIWLTECSVFKELNSIVLWYFMTGA